MKILLEQDSPVKKATISAVDDLDNGSDGGSLQPVQRRDFFRKIKNQMVMNNHAMIVPMTGNGVEIPMIDVSGRVLQKDTNQTSTKRAVDTSEVTMNGKRVKAVFQVTRSFFEQNVEGENAMDTLVDIFSAAMANGLEEMLFLSSTTGPAVKESEYNNDRDSVGSTTQYKLDDLMNLFDGMITTAVASGATVNGSNTTDIRKLVTQAKKELPTKFRDAQYAPMLRIFMPLDIVENLRYALSTRPTELGDITLTESGQLKIAGILVVGVPLLNNTPKYVEHVLLGNTSTAKSLSFAYIDKDDVIVTTSGLTTTAVTPYVDTTDYVIHETNGTITAAGATTPSTTVKVTYNTPPLFILTPWNNILFGINEDFRIGFDEDVDKDVMLCAIRTRIDFKYLENNGVVIVKNIQDALPTSTPL